MYKKLRSALANLPRVWKRVILIAFDIIGLSLALWASYALRYGAWVFPNTLDQAAIILTGPLIAIPVFVRMGLYRAVIRYLPERAIWTILQAMTIATVCWVVLVFLSEMSGRGVVPRSVPVLYWALGTVLIGGSRFAAKKFLWVSNGMRSSDHPVAIYGAGEAGAQLAMALRRQGNKFIVGFIDDSRALQGRDVAGLRVFPPSDLYILVEQYGVSEVILSIPSLNAIRQKEIVAKISGQGVKIRTLPHIADLVSGKYLVNQIREIDIDELLGRSSVPADTQLVREMVKGKTIMVTGAGGSIGSELCRLIVKWAPQRLVLFEANEFALYQIERELSAVRDRSIVPILGSIVDKVRVEHAINSYGVQVVFHAAAHKHVPLVEVNALEGIRNNVLGSLNVADAAFNNGVESFVLISSDKAVRPTNVMGATKRWAELIVRQKSIEALAKGTGQRFCAVRFGNVLGSNGSVVPLFKEQIAKGGPVTLTDPEMTRYFMSIHEAAELIVQAGALSQGGDVFLLEMGSPILIRDLAENMIRLAGFSVRDDESPSGDIEIVVTGKRPGEKMYEELFYDETSANSTRHPKILRAASSDATHKDLEVALRSLIAALDAQSERDARHILFDFIK
ncbi:polysaccharide biosynthesis protein [Devosia psychrophila]|nr:nucleoside-diphosphate sugar epimerase/dehydratase [Devosia psychrophila]KKC34566.1 capsular biosynthesis protein [Devosia psychrophila]